MKSAEFAWSLLDAEWQWWEPRITTGAKRNGEIHELLAHRHGPTLHEPGSAVDLDQVFMRWRAQLRNAA
jgi:hypothetical protein